METRTTEKAQDVLAQIVAAFENGDIVEGAAATVIPGEGRPSSRWSWNNRIIMWMAGTQDARGYRQWNDVGRHVIKGAKAFCILGPVTITMTDEDDDGNEVKVKKVVGFKAIPVFRFEDTDGEDLPTYEPPQPPPPMGVAGAWGLGVSYRAFADGDGARGSFHIRTKDIELATHDAQTFFHELAHAADDRLNGNLKGGQDWHQEIVAELAAVVLGRLYGVAMEGKSYRYIGHYAYQAGMDVGRACVAVLGDVEQVLALILRQEGEHGE